MFYNIFIIIIIICVYNLTDRSHGIDWKYFGKVVRKSESSLQKHMVTVDV